MVEKKTTQRASVASKKKTTSRYTPTSSKKPAKTSAKSVSLSKQQEIAGANSSNAYLKTPTSIHSSFTKPATQTASTSRQANLKTPPSAYRSSTKSLTDIRNSLKKTSAQPRALATGRDKVSTVKTTAAARSKKKYM